MGAYSEAAEFYDLLYGGTKDYDAEARLLADLVRERVPGAGTILDVGCGTGAHARALIDIGFAVDGVDVEAAFVEIAAAKCPEGTFTVGDMRSLDLPTRYDVVACLFSAIGYVLTVPALEASVERLAAHLAPGGIVLVDPWFEPGEMDHGHVMTVQGEDEDRCVVRMSRTVIEDRVSRLEFEYLIGTGAGLERRSEMHELGLFTHEEMVAAFERAGLVVERLDRTLRTRGLYVGVSGDAVL